MLVNRNSKYSLSFLPCHKEIWPRFMIECYSCHICHRLFFPIFLFSEDEINKGNSWQASPSIGLVEYRWCHDLFSFLGPRGPHGIPLSVRPLVRPSVRPQEKFGSHIYRHICLKNHLKTHQTNLMAPWDPLDVPLTPWDPQAPPIDRQ